MDIPAAPVSLSSAVARTAKVDNLTGTIKWLVAAAGAIAAAIVAGLQLTAIANLQPWAAIVAAGGAAAALLAIGSFLLQATRVLAIQGPTVVELSNQELNAGILEPSANLDIKALPPLIAWVRERRMSLLGDASSVTSLYTDGVVGARRALDSLRKGQKSKWGGRNLNPRSTSDVAWLREEYAAATIRVERLEEAAVDWERRKAYSDVIDRAPKLFSIFITGILVFAIIPVWGRPDAASEIKDPLPAQIYVLDARAARVPTHCPATLAGQVIGGPLDKPTVVTVPTGSCPALKLRAEDDSLIVLPNPTGSALPNR